MSDKYVMNEEYFNECDSCDIVHEQHETYKLIDSLVNEIILLEEEMIRWRKALVYRLPDDVSEGLQSDIFNNLAARYEGNAAYRKYMKARGYTKDPLEAKEHLQRLTRLSTGTDETSVRL